MRLPSNGMGFPSGFMRGSAITLSQAALRASFDDQTIHENTTVSSSLRWTAIGNDVILPSGTSSPQHSTTLSAPYSLKMAAASSACFLNFSRLAVGTAGYESVDVGHDVSPATSGCSVILAIYCPVKRFSRPRDTVRSPACNSPGVDCGILISLAKLLNLGEANVRRGDDCRRGGRIGAGYLR